ncbi:MAG: dephospho-CoA kinase [Chitinophagaceae bacterium]|nr:dephospho-CoA kinase [Chitinophagaceae bacterium]
MLKIGVTGGIGSGKSTVCRIFETLGIPVYYADIEAKKLYDENLVLKKKVIEHFGTGVYPEGIFDKAKMRDLVFKDSQKLNTLNSLVHPFVGIHFNEWIKKQQAPYIIKEAALFIESGSYKEMDELILVISSLETRIGRLGKRDGFTKEEIMQRIKLQTSDEEKMKYCNYQIRNSTEDLLIPQVIQLHDLFLNRTRKE